jgi:hypothetical protein
MADPIVTHEWWPMTTKHPPQRAGPPSNIRAAKAQQSIPDSQQGQVRPGRWSFGG